MRKCPWKKTKLIQRHFEVKHNFNVSESLTSLCRKALTVGAAATCIAPVSKKTIYWFFFLLKSEIEGTYDKIN